MTINLYEEDQKSRAFVQVSEVTRAVVLGVTSADSDVSTLHVAADRTTTVERTARLRMERFRSRMQPAASGRYRLEDSRRGHADTTAIYKQLKFVQDIYLEQELGHSVAWAKHFSAWVEQQPTGANRLKNTTRDLLSRGLYGGICHN